MPNRWVLLRDIGSWLAGWVVVFLEIRRPEVREVVMMFCTGAVGVPMLAAAGQVVAEAVSARRGGTGSPPEESPASPSSP